jgi:O-acetyl-ADP-ribose deacetylase (regulator of RNase III)
MSNNRNRISVVQTDITTLNVSAIVNAANTSLLGGGGVDGAIHKAAGPELLAECKTLGGCPTGEVRLTKGYNLPATYVMHTPGPVWRGGMFDESALLRSCYINCLKLAGEMKLESIAFPSISTGVYHFPVRLASRIVLKAVREYLAEGHEFPRKIVFACLDLEVFTAYKIRVREEFPEA